MKKIISSFVFCFWMMKVFSISIDTLSVNGKTYILSDAIRKKQTTIALGIGSLVPVLPISNSLGLSFEKKQSNYSTLKIALNFNTIYFNWDDKGVFFYVFPAFEIEKRFYYNVSKQIIKKNKISENNAYNFVGIHSNFYFPVYENSEGKHSLYPNYAFTAGATWNLQKSIHKKFLYHLRIGAQLGFNGSIFALPILSNNFYFVL